MTSDDCLRTATGDGVDPSGVPWSQISPEQLHRDRTSIKWARYPEDVIPMFVAEMDFTIAPEIKAALIKAVEQSDLGYLLGAGELAPTFADFASDRWGWKLDPAHVRTATDVATGVVEALRVFRPNGGKLVLATPTYPGFFEMLQELPLEVREVPLVETGAVASLDLAAIEREFEQGATAYLLGNPHNPHGVAFTRAELSALAELAAKHNVFVMSDEIHAPLTHHGTTFTPFAPFAVEAGALSATATSASKGWNLAGAKCSLLIAADDRANETLQHLPPEVSTRTSILGWHASIAALRDGRAWLDRAITQIEANQALFAALVAERLPSVHYTPGHAGYVAWLDFRDSGLGENPTKRLLTEAKLALNDGHHFGRGGAGFGRINLAAAPDTILRGVDRIAELITQAKGEQA